MAGGGAVHYGRVPGRPVPSPLANERISACQPRRPWPPPDSTSGRIYMYGTRLHVQYVNTHT
eukprot:COSAG01_NODE_20581_length_947_cov_0.811321_1_plen_61_part_10